MAKLLQVVKRSYAPGHRYLVYVNNETLKRLEAIWEARGKEDTTIQSFLSSIVAYYAQQNAPEE